MSTVINGYETLLALHRKKPHMPFRSIQLTYMYCHGAPLN